MNIRLQGQTEIEQRIELGDLRAQLAAAEAQNAALREALRSVWAAVNDRLLAKGPLATAYAHAVTREVNDALALPSPRADALLRVVEAARNTLDGLPAFIADAVGEDEPEDGEPSNVERAMALPIWAELRAALAAYREATNAS